MPRIRTLKPEAPQHRKVGRLSIPARWLWLTLITQSDDQGRLVADPGQLRVQAFPYDLDVTDSKVSELLAEIAATGLIQCYSVRNVPYACFPSWKDHQRIDKPTASKLPPPPQLRSTRARRGVAEDSPRVRRGLPPDRKGSERIKDQGSERKEGSPASNQDPTPISDLVQRIAAKHPELRE